MEVVAALAGVLLLLAAAGVGTAYLSRRSTLTRRVGSFVCTVRADGSSVPPTRGVAQYATGRLVWWRLRSLSPRPARSWSRRDLVLVERVRTGQDDGRGEELLRVRCEHRGEPFELTLPAGACSGLVSWLEAAPRDVGRVF